MDTGSLHKLHNSRNEYLLSIADGVNLDLLASDIFINQQWLILINLYCGFQIVPQSLLFGHDLHRPAAQDKAGAHQYRIANFSSSPYAILNRGHRLTFGLGNIK